MTYTTNEFKRYLMTEIQAKSNGTPVEILKIIDEFSKTDEYSRSFQKWMSLNKNKKINGLVGPKHIGKLINA